MFISAEAIQLDAPPKHCNPRLGNDKLGKLKQHAGELLRVPPRSKTAGRQTKSLAQAQPGNTLPTSPLHIYTNHNRSVPHQTPPTCTSSLPVAPSVSPSASVVVCLRRASNARIALVRPKSLRSRNSNRFLAAKLTGLFGAPKDRCDPRPMLGESCAVLDKS